MMKVILLIVELIVTIASLLLVFNMTAAAMGSYQQAQDVAYVSINQMQQKNADMYGSPSGYIPAAAGGILSSLTNFRI
jgi:hypothetical protein